MPDQNRRGNPNWQKGGPSPNPGGRPKGTITAALREIVDPREVAQFLAETMRGEGTTKLSDRVLAAQLIYDRLEGRSVSRTELRADITTRAEDPFEDLSDEELAALEARETAVLSAMEPGLLLPAGEVTEAEIVSELVGMEARTPLPAARSAETRMTPGAVAVEPDPATSAIATMAARAERHRSRRSTP